MKPKKHTQTEILKREFRKNILTIGQKLKQAKLGISKVTLSRIIGAFPSPLQEIREQEIETFLKMVENPEPFFKGDVPEEIFGNPISKIRFLFEWVEYYLSCHYPKIKTGPRVSQDAVAKWEKEKQFRLKWATRIPNEVLYSKVYFDMDHGSAIKLLHWCYMKTRQRKIQGRRGKNKYQLVDEGKFSFTYSEAYLFGLSSGQFSRALREIHQRGFIDIVKMGSGLRGDFSVFKLSERWRNFGTKAFEVLEFPAAMGFGFQGRSLTLKRDKNQE